MKRQTYEKRSPKLCCKFHNESGRQHHNPVKPDVEVDWSCFTKDSFAYCQGQIPQKIEDDIYGCIKIIYGGEPYLIDVHHEYYDASQTGYDLEIYTAAKDGNNATDIGEHVKWIGSVKAIKTSSSYESFKKRAVKEIINLLYTPVAREAIFSTTQSDLMKYNGTIVSVGRKLTDQEADISEVGTMYKIIFNDGVHRDAFEDELEFMLEFA